RLLNQGTGPSLTVHKEASRVFDTNERSRCALCVVKRKLFESTTYLQDDRLTIECIITVSKEPRVTGTKSFPRIEVPPSDIVEHFGKLLETKEGVDVTFSVGGVDLKAHKMVLAAQSPVFRAELYGPMKEGGTEPIVVEDIHPDVFRGLLHFIYNDSLPPFDDLMEDDYGEMIHHLLVAADRYAMERLKLMCQSILCEGLHVQTVATTLALADQHHCDMLKDACIEFIICSNAMDAVAATPGYKNLKRTCPSVVIEALEKTSRIRRA
ncbi:BTB/POZ and MATH domain-containing protein 2-like, partial [Panicum virgatum]